MRKWLYNKNAEPTIFKGKEAIEKALKDGWVKSPVDINKKSEAIEAVTIEKKSTKKKVTQKIDIDKTIEK